MRLNQGRRFLCALLTALPIGSVCAQVTSLPPMPDVVTAALFRAEVGQDLDGSTWYTGEKQTFTQLLSAGHFDWLIVPAQTQREGLDRAERSMMTSELARAIVAHRVSAPDPYLVERALGEGRRQISLDHIDAVARQLHVRVIVVPYVGHDDSNNLWVTLAVYRKPDGASALTGVRPQYLAAAKQHLDDAIAPVDTFARLLPDLLAGLALPAQPPSVPLSGSPLATLPESPEQLAQAGDENPLGEAARFAVLGELAPPETRASEHLFERSLLAARRAARSPEQQFLLANALLRLNHRQAAVEVLHATPTPALAALREVVNGNFTGTAALVRRTTGYERLVLDFQFMRMSRAYGRAANDAKLPPTLAALAGHSPVWKVLLERRWDYGREGAQHSNVAFKRLLDRIYPIPGQSLEEIARAQAATPGVPFGEMDLELSAHHHIQRLLSERASDWCCTSSFYRPGPGDLLAVIDAWSDVNLISAVRTELNFRGLPDVAETILSRLDREYGGHPNFEVLHAQADIARAQVLPAAQQGTLRASAHAHALRAFLAAGGQTAEAIDALSILGPDPLTQGLARGLGSDYPFNGAWLFNDFVIDPAKRLDLERRALASSQIDVSFASRALSDGQESIKPEIRAALQGRFMGSPGLEALLSAFEPVKSTWSDQDVADMIAKLRKKVREQPDVWDARTELAGWLEANFRFVEAAQVLVDYPAFHLASPSNPVALSNIAADAGGKLYWKGAQLQARQLYRIATRYGVGSEAEMSAATRLRLLDGDLNGALAEAGRRADRYPDGVSYSTYLSLLHLLGHSQQSWKAFDLLLNQPLGAGPWESAMVGLRIAGTTRADLDRWIDRPEISGLGSTAVYWPARLLLMWATTDRTASAGLAERIISLSHEPIGVIEGTERVASYPSGDSGPRIVVPRSAFRAEQRAPLKFGTAVPSHQVLFARALIPLQQGDFAAAIARFDELAARYPIEQIILNADAVYALPEFAYASAMAGDPLRLESFLKTLPPGTQFFELSLARAYFQGILHRDAAAALKDLDEAFVLIQNYLGRTPSMQYQFADTAERLYRTTSDRRFRKRAVTWAHTMQRLEPWCAWSYSIEAELTDDPTARRAALLKAMYLDPLSSRLKALPSADLDWARTQLKSGNPFLQPNNPAQDANQRTALTLFNSSH